MDISKNNMRKEADKDPNRSKPQSTKGKDDSETGLDYSKPDLGAPTENDDGAPVTEERDPLR
jgi:hypothetical protein